MKTEVLKVSRKKPEKEKLARAAAVLRAGGTVVIPTDTVYGLAASAFDREAQRKIYRMKGRRFSKPLIIMPRDVDSLALVAEIQPHARNLMRQFWPGPLTLILSATALGKIVMGGRSDLGARIPDDPVVRELLEGCDFPLATTSANPSGKPSAKTAGEALKYLDGKVDLVIDAGPAPLGQESTVIDAASFHCIVLREGCLPSKKLLPYLV